MAYYLPPKFQGIDYNNWASWEPYQLGGSTYYKVPGVSDYVYDPARGVKGTYINVDTLNRMHDQLYPPTPSTGSQILGGITPILGNIAQTVGASYLMNLLGLGKNQQTNNSAGLLSDLFASQLGSSGFFGGGGGGLGDFGIPTQFGIGLGSGDILNGLLNGGGGSSSLGADAGAAALSAYTGLPVPPSLVDSASNAIGDAASSVADAIGSIF